MPDVSRTHTLMILVGWAALTLGAFVPLYRGILILRDVARVRGEVNPYQLSPEMLTTRHGATSRPLPGADLNLISVVLTNRWREEHNQRLQMAAQRRPMGIGLVVLCPVLIGAWTGIAWMMLRHRQA